jgi:hypothetical protein
LPARACTARLTASESRGGEPALDQLVGAAVGPVALRRADEQLDDERDGHPEHHVAEQRLGSGQRAQPPGDGEGAGQRAYPRLAVHGPLDRMGRG